MKHNALYAKTGAKFNNELSKGDKKYRAKIYVLIVNFFLKKQKR